MVRGGDGRDVILTSAGNDDVEAGDGNDHIATGAGDDIVDAGGGDDRCWDVEFPSACETVSPTSDPSAYTFPMMVSAHVRPGVIEGAVLGLLTEPCSPTPVLVERFAHGSWEPVRHVSDAKTGFGAGAVFSVDVRAPGRYRARVDPRDTQTSVCSGAVSAPVVVRR